MDISDSNIIPTNTTTTNNDNHYSISQPVYVSINRYVIDDKKHTTSATPTTSTNAADDVSVLEISATEVSNTTNTNSNTVVNVHIDNFHLAKTIELNVALICLLLVLDTLFFIKYLYVPIVLYSFFGPVWIVFPWSILAAINYLIQMIVIYYGENGLNMHILSMYRTRQNRILVPTEIIDHTHDAHDNDTHGTLGRLLNEDNNIENNIDNNNNNNDNNIGSIQEVNTSVVEAELIDNVYIPKRRLIFIMALWSLIDGFISVVSAAIAMIIVLFICQDVNSITTGYGMYWRLLLTGISFSICSLALRSILIIYPVLCCRCNIYSCFNSFSLLGITGSGQQLQFSRLAKKCINYASKFLFVASFIMFLIALGFSLASLVFFVHPLTKNTSSIKYSDCDPMVPLACSLPFPSSYWLDTDTTTESGFRVSIDHNTFPYVKTSMGKHIDTTYLNEFDGFSVSAGILWHLDNVRDEDLISYEYIKRSTLLNSTTLLIDRNLNTLFPHFTERDYSNPDPERIFYIQPAISLKFKTQYVVVVKGLKDNKGNLLQPSSVTSAYVAAFKKSQSIIEGDPRYARLLSTLTYLNSQSIDLNEIQLIWDFVTASESSTLGIAKTIATNTNMKISKVISQKPYRSVYQSQNSGCKNYLTNGAPEMKTSLYFEIEVPWLLQSESRLRNRFNKELLDPTNIDKIPMQGGVGLFVQVPCSVYLGMEITAVVQFGHGIFGSKSDTENAQWLQSEASYYGWILWSMDWRGFDRFDIPIFVKALLYDVDLVTSIRDSTMQGYINKLTGKAYIYHILDDFKEDLGLDTSIDYVAAISFLPARYIGDSMGSILGSGFVPLAGYDRVVYIVPGSPFSFVAQRSSLFSLYAILLGYQFYNHIDVRIVMNSWQILLDAAESSGWANTNAYNNTNILAQIGLGDSTGNVALLL